jgi:hypothetical protein
MDLREKIVDAVLQRGMSKTLSENIPVRLEEGRISSRMGLPMSPFSKETRPLREPNTTKKSVDYFRPPRPLWRKLKKCLPKKRKKSGKRGGRPRASDRAVLNGIWYVLFGPAANGRPSIGIGLGCPQASSTNVSRAGGRRASSRS